MKATDTARSTTATPDATREVVGQTEYEIEPDVVDGIPADFIAGESRGGAVRVRISPRAELVLIGLGFGFGFGAAIELFRLAAWLLAPEVGR